jgi:hypothetical protein
MSESNKKAYLEANGVEAAISEALQAVLRERPADPITALANLLIAHKGSSTKEDNPLGDEELRKVEKPVVSVERAVALASDLYGLSVDPNSVKELDSYGERPYIPPKATPHTPLSLTNAFLACARSRVQTTATSTSARSTTDRSSTSPLTPMPST